MKISMKVWVLLGLFTGGIFLSGRAEEQQNFPTGPYYGVFRELPVTDIAPDGWLKQFLERQRDGLALHRDASGFPFNTCLWNGKIPNAKWPHYEQTGYYLDGTYRCGLLLGCEPLIDQARQSIRYVLDHPASNGVLGPGPGDYVNVVKDDGVAGPKTVGIQWPFAVFVRTMIADYGVTHNKEILDALTKHFLALPAGFGPGPRDVDSVECMCWLYGQTGDKRILDVAERTWNNATKNPKGQWNLANMTKEAPMRGHGVTVSEATKQPALLYLYTGKKEYLDAVLGGFRSLQRDNELVDGVITSDASLSGKAPDHQHETCVISDYTWSLGYVLMASGDAHWADTIERAILNAGFGAIDKEFKTLQYYSSPNQVIATKDSNVPTTGNPNRDLQSYRPDFNPECCTGNSQRMIPNYAVRTWMSDGKGGLAAALYAPSTVHTKVGAHETDITVTEKTDYPFDGVIELKITADNPVKFPLYVRIPGWAEGAKVSINGKPVDDRPVAGTFLKIEREFASGDVVKLDLPMLVRMEKPVPSGVSLVRGPLVYSLRIKEAKAKVSKTLAMDPDFPGWDVTPASPWNYALALKGPQDISKIKVESKPVTDFPWTPSSVPVVLTVPAKKIPAWGLTPAGKNPPLPALPVQLAPETEQVELIPDGATMLRVLVFPDASETMANSAK